MDYKAYVQENKGTVLAASGSGAILGWMIGKSMTGVVLGAAIVPVLVAVGVTKFLDKGSA